MIQQINKNLIFLNNSYTKYTGAILEGSSRSGKTIASIDFIILLASKSKDKFILNIVRDTYNSFKTTLYLDFDKRLKDFGLVSPFSTSQEVASFKLFGNQINFIGADKPSKFEGAGADYWYFNELIDIEKLMFNLAEQRCRVFWWGDFNPKYSQHWVYDSILQRQDVAYLHSTFKDNPFISEIERKKILSYEPTEYNISQGTDDDYMWRVYGLGERTSRDGLVFKKWTKFSVPPESYDLKIYGMDFGYSNDPTSVVECLINGNDLYITELLYETGLLNTDIADRLRYLDVNNYIVADSADPKSIDDLRSMGLSVISAIKGADSIRYGIAKINSYNLFIHENSSNLINELYNYSYTTDKKTGNSLNIPIDKFNHAIDAIRYAVTLY